MISLASTGTLSSTNANDDVDLAWEKFIQKYNEAERECILKKVVTTSKDH